MNYGVFIERDGVLNSVRVERQAQVQPATLDEFRVLNHALKPLNELKKIGLLLIVTTNQPGISSGSLPRREMDLMHTVLRKRLPLDDILFCPHLESDRCPCRKPNPGMFKEAAHKWHLDLNHSYVVSDKWPDAEAAMAAGCTSLLIKSPWNGAGHHDFVLNDLAGAAEKIVQLHEAVQR